MAGDIKQKIVLEGEKDYREALKAAQRNLKTLKSELKAETAELGKNATAQQKAEAKAKSLQKQIKEQEKVVQTYKQALEEVREKYGDNEEAISKYEQKLNEARATLADMKNSLEDVSGGFQAISDGAASSVLETKALADSFGSISEKAGSMASAIEGVFKGVMDRVWDLASDVWDIIADTAAKANSWTDIAGYWNTDAQTIQKWAHAVGASANNFEDLQSAVSRIVMGGKGEKITELLGISDENYKDQWAYAMAVMDQISLMQKSGKDMTPIYEQLFGEKKSTKIMDLINDWDYIQSKLSEFDGNTGDYGMSDEELDTMNNLWVEINTFEEKWDALKMKIAAGLGEASMTIVTSATGALDALARFLNTDDPAEKEQALEDFKKNVKTFFEGVVAAIREALGVLEEVGESLKTSDDPAVAAIGTILDSLADTLQWMIDNQDAVKHAFETIFGVWLVAKLTSIATKLASIIAQIGIIRTFSGLGGVASGAAAGATGAAAGGAAGATAAGGGAAVGTTVGKALGTTAAKVLGGAAAGIAVLMENAIKHQGNDDIFTKEEEDLFNQGIITQEMKAKMVGARANELGTAVIDQNGNTVYVTDEELNGGRNHNIRQRNIEGIAEPIITQTNGFFTDLLNKLQQNTVKDSLPSWLFSGSQPWLTSQDINTFTGLPAQMSKAVASGVSGIKVTMDGRTVGNLVAPYVSQYIASTMPMVQ